MFAPTDFDRNFAQRVGATILNTQILTQVLLRPIFLNTKCPNPQLRGFPCPYRGIPQGGLAEGGVVLGRGPHWRGQDRG